MNNTFIRRGIHIAVRDFDTNELINDEYGPLGSPFVNARQKNGKVLWYRPADYMHERYVNGEENEPGYAPKRDDPDFDIDSYPNKKEWYF